MKTTFKYQILEGIDVAATPVTKGIVGDKKIQLNSSKQIWRLIQFISTDGKVYEYLTNDFTLSLVVFHTCIDGLLKEHFVALKPSPDGGLGEEKLKQLFFLILLALI